MNVASLENCKELYELSGWETSRDRYYPDRKPQLAIGPFGAKLPSTAIPAYDLGYLLRKLPSGVTLFSNSNGGDPNDYSIKYENGEWITADTPEDAACKLAIELFKQGVLK